MADQDPSTPSSPTGPSGTADERLAALQNLEDGEAKKQSQMKWVDGANYGMLGADLGYGAYAAGTAATAAGATGAAAAGAAALAAVPAVVALGGAWLLGKIGVTGAVEKGAEWLGDKLGLSIGKGDPHPACVGDDIAHSSGFWGMMAGLAIGVAIGAAVAATVATGGLAGAVIVGACMAGGLSLGSGLAAASQSLGSNCGKIASGSGNVTFEGKAAARVTDIIACDKHPGPEPLVEGSLTITVNQLPLVRVGHSSHCSGKVNSGRKSVLIDKTTGQFGPKNPELTAGEEFFAGLVGGLLGAKLGGLASSRSPKSEPTQSAERQGVKDETSTKYGDPIDVATGEMVDMRTDLTIPGVLPLTLVRRYRTRSEDEGLLGPKWSVNWSQRLCMDDGHLVRYHDGNGLVITFEAPETELDAINLREPRFQLRGTRTAPQILDNDTRQIVSFGPLVDGATSRLERIEDRSNNAIIFKYDAAGRLVAVEHTSGYWLALAYLGASRLVVSITLHDDAGTTLRLADYAYDEGRLVHVSSLQGGQFRYIYDDHGWITSWSDTDQTAVHHRYDDAGRVIETGSRGGHHAARLIYEPGCTRVLDGDGERVYEYNAEGLVTRETNPLGHSVEREWTLGRVVAQTDALGRRTDFRYDSHGYLVAIQEPTGATTHFQYDRNRLLTVVVLPSGGRATFNYDACQRLVERVAPDGTVERYRYGEQGELLRIVEGERETRLEYDARQRLIATRLPTGVRLRTQFDLLGRLLEEIDPEGNVTRYDHMPGPLNPRGALRQITLADGAVHTIAYNSEGLPISQTDPMGGVTRNAYGPFDLLIATVDAAGHATSFEYDHAARLTRVTNALGENWEVRYDAVGRVVTEVDWGGRTTHFVRDAVGRVVCKRLPDGGTLHYAYDEADRLIGVEAGDVRLAYTYDSAGRLSTATVHGEVTHVTQFRYDGHGRLIEENQHGHVLRHLYDAQGSRVERHTPGRQTRYAYNALGELTQVGALTIERDGLGREVGRQAGEFVAKRQYDAVGRLSRQTAGSRSAFSAMQTDPAWALRQLSRQHYHYNVAGQMVGVDTEMDSLVYQLDMRGQVTAVSGIRQPAEHYAYDAVGNITAHGRRGPLDRHHYLPGGLPERVGHTRYRYDGRGRTVEKTVEQPGFRPKTWRFGWDGLDRLVKVHGPDQRVWRYRYDAFNRRVEKLNGATGESTCFVWDAFALAERWKQSRDGTTGQVVTWHITSECEPLAQETDSGLYPVMTDQVGMPKVIFDEAGRQVWSAAHTFWGRMIQSHRAANDEDAIDLTLRYPGQWEDEESGLSYNLNRYYDPETGQYLSADPLRLSGGFRTHGYVENPALWVDPFGLQACPYGGYYRRKNLRRDVYNAERPPPGTRHATKHISARTPEQAKEMSLGKGTRDGKPEASYLPEYANKVGSYEKQAAYDAIRNGQVFDHGGTRYLFYKNPTGPVGYNGGKLTDWVRVEMTDNPIPTIHSFPASLEQVGKYIPGAK